MRKNLLIAILILAIASAFFYYHTKKVEEAYIAPEKTKDETVPVSLSTKTIKEKNFTGTKPVILGSSVVATRAQAYVEEQVDEFRKQSNTDVPGMREEFGTDSPTANYEINIDAKYAKSEKTESVALNVYTYTGGAHGSSFYKVFTGSLTDGKILSLSDVVKKSEQASFAAFVKKELNAWRPEDNMGSTGSVIFPEDVEALGFSSFANWSLDDKNLTIYFSQYEIGPGALGAVAFPLPLSKIKNFLEPNFST